MTYTDAATFAATASPASTYAATFAPLPEIEHVVPAPVTTHVVLAPVFEYVVPAPAIENIAPAPAVTFDAPSPQLLPAYTMTTVNPGVSFDITSLVSPQFSSTAVEASAPQVVVSLPPFEEFTAPVYNQVHQEQIVAGEMTQNIVENPAVQEWVIVQEIPPVFERIQERNVEPIEVRSHERVQKFTAEQIMHMPVPQTQEQSAVTDLVNPPISITADEVVDSSEEVAINTSSTSTSSSAHVFNREETTSRDRLDALASMLDSCLEQLPPLGGYVSRDCKS